jgi:LysR family transcriptional regulator, hydrogen peroxide-inducible genes activator
MITLIQLEYITALDTYRHFATAAEKCFVTQPTLSMQIKKMEDELGIVLFDRTRQPVIPTEQGKYIIKQARVILQEAKKIKTIVDDVKQQITGDLRIGVIPTIAPYLLPLFAGKLKNIYPNINLKIDETVTENIEDMLLKDMLDVGIVVTPLNNSLIIEQPLYYEEMMVYHHPKHQFSEKQIVSAEEMDPYEIWLLGDGHCFRNQVINFCEIREFKSSHLPFEFEGGSIDTLMKIIDKEGGYTLIPELAVMEKADSTQVKSFSKMKPLREVSLIYTRKFAKTRLIELLAASIKNAIPEKLLNKERGLLVEWR